VTRYLSLAEFWYLAEHVTGINAATLVKASRVELADSALHAPLAGFDDTDFYPDPYDKAAVVACRIAWNHPLPDGNKRAAWAASCCSSTSTMGHGTTSNPTPTTPSRQCSRWRHAGSMRPGSRAGFANGSPSEPEAGSRSGNPGSRLLATSALPAKSVGSKSAMGS
jgi:death-on-curing protein